MGAKKVLSVYIRIKPPFGSERLAVIFSRQREPESASEIRAIEAGGFRVSDTVALLAGSMRQRAV